MVLSWICWKSKNIEREYHTAMTLIQMTRSLHYVRESHICLVHVTPKTSSKLYLLPLTHERHEIIFN